MIKKIEMNLHKPFTLEGITSVSELPLPLTASIFYFLTGENLETYILKRKLTLAAEDLINTEKMMVDIARKWGFEDLETFNILFKSRFGTTPFTYRSKGFSNPFLIREMLEEKELNPRTDLRLPEPEISFLGPGTLKGVKKDMNMNEHINQTLFSSLFSGLYFMEESPHYGTIYQVIIPKREKGNDFSEDSVILENWLAVEKSDDAPIKSKDNMITTLALSRKRYALFTNKFDIYSCEEALKYIYGIWFEESGEAPADGPIMYLSAFTDSWSRFQKQARIIAVPLQDSVH